MDLCGMRLLGTKVCKKHDLGVHNNLFGGTMLSWIDELAGQVRALWRRALTAAAR